MAEIVPIIMVHRADYWPVYVAASALQTARMNPDTPIYFVTNAEKIPDPKLHMLRYDDFEPVLEEFRSIYFHLSRLDYFFERTCIERWFIIREIMRVNNYKRVFCTDSDVLMFNVISGLARRFEHVDYTIHEDISWGTTFINRPEVLDAFCDIVIKAYNRDPEVWPHLAGMIGFDRPYQKLPNVSDMGFLGLLKLLYKDKYRWCDAGEVIAGSVIDPNINSPAPGMEMENGRKKLEWIDGLPYGRLAESRELVRFDLLHFQGVHAKGLMREIYDKFTPTYEKLLKAG